MRQGDVKKRQEARDKRQETRDKRQETRDKRQETRMIMKILKFQSRKIFQEISKRGLI